MPKQVSKSRQEIVRSLRQAGIPVASDLDINEPLLSTSEVAIVLRASEGAIREWADAGKIQSLRTLGGRRRFPATAVVAAMESMFGDRRRTRTATEPNE